MLIEAQDMPSRFSEHLEWATRVDIATAWATGNDGLRKLQEKSERLKIRVVVGLWGNITDPMVLRTLDSIGKLRVVGSDRRFHPKIFVFRNKKKSVAWIGSANFTSGGFGVNEELMFETQDTEAIEAWFKRLWRGCDRLEDGAIEEYARKRKRNPPEPLPLPKGVTPRLEDGPLELLQGVADWNGYVDALRQCDMWWLSRTDDYYSVLGEANCWEETIRELRFVVNRDLKRISEDEKKALLGLRSADDKWALLGRMRQPAFKAIFLNKYNLNTVKDALRDVTGADDGDFPGAAIDTYKRIIRVNQVAHGTATRLLALARPDYIVSFNKKSRNGLEEYLGLSLSGEPLPPEKYRTLLESLYEKPWFNVPHPKNPHEGSIWSMRAALIDCFVYNGDGPG